MRDDGVHGRRWQRLLGRAREDAGQAGRLLCGRTRMQFAHDLARRDAVEQRLRRVSTIMHQVAEQDGEARSRLGVALQLLEPLRSAQSIDRMDSDVLCGLVAVCRLHLLPAIEELLGAGVTRISGQPDGSRGS